MDTVLRLHAVEPPGDMLVFLTGMDEVDHCVSLLKVGKYRMTIQVVSDLRLTSKHNICFCMSWADIGMLKIQVYSLRRPRSQV